MWPNGLQHAGLPCPSLSPTVCQDSCPLSQWCCLTISSSAVRFSFCLQSFPASGSFLMSRLFALGGQSIGASASASVLAVNIQGWLPLKVKVKVALKDWPFWSLCYPRDSPESSPESQFKSINSLALWLLYGPTATFVHDQWRDRNLWWQWWLGLLIHCLGLTTFT